MKLGHWTQRENAMPWDRRRFWLGGYDDDDLAAIVGKDSTQDDAFGWRAFSPDGEKKWQDEGRGCSTPEAAMAAADKALRTYGAS